MDMSTEYTPPLALTVISGVFLALGAICAAVVVGDIVWRRGWRSMMWIMIPVYPINAAYMLPVTLYVYFKYGRPTKPDTNRRENDASVEQANKTDSDATHSPPSEQPPNAPEHCQSPSPTTIQEQPSHSAEAEKGPSSHCHHHADADARPMWATVLIGVSHCGAGCVLGDLVGEWLVHGTGATLNGAEIWVELLVDYAFALLFGIAFQYFSIAPMSGEWGPRSLWRAAKADVLSLTSFEVGAFAWMVVYQVGIFGYRLSMTTWTYWWMMQVGMALGFATAMPMNWFLISKGIKEPCA